MKTIRFHYFLILPLLLFSLSAGAQEEVKAVKGSLHNDEFHTAYTPSFENDGVHKPVKNVILMIGDGMGLAHVAAAMYANHGELTITNLRTIGLVRTQSANDFTTDSAASGTAYATGKKTNNKAIGVDTEGNPSANLTEKLSALGYHTGVLTTDDMDGATPSAFYAHQPDRGMSNEILGDLPGSRLTFFGGGSRQEVDKLRPELWQELKKAGFTVVGDVKDKSASSAPRLGVLPDAKYTASVSKNRGDFLPRTTAFALDFLAGKGGEGFFIMIEGARIDKSSHDNDFKSAVQETLDFDLAVEAAIRFAEHDGQTLVIISADHETGGVTLSSKGDVAKGEVRGVFASRGHTPVMVPLYAYGPHSDVFAGVQENSDVSNKIYELLSAGKKK